MEIDHVGVVVKNIEQEIKFWFDTFGYMQKTDVVVNTRQKVKVVFLKKQDSIDIKLVEPIDEYSSVYRFARKGGGLHHLCFKCDEMQTRLLNLKKNGMRLLAEPQPGEAFDNEAIAFLMGSNCVNVELIDTEKRAGLIV